MFSNFFYICKAKGLNITLSEWLTLQDALDKGLCNSSLTEFYYVARMILVKSETDFDKFDMAFEEAFKGIQSENEISKNMMRWLDKSELIDMVDEEERYRMNEQDGMQFIDKDEVEAKFKERLRLEIWVALWVVFAWVERLDIKAPSRSSVHENIKTFVMTECLTIVNFS